MSSMPRDVSDTFGLNSLTPSLSHTWEEAGSPGATGLATLLYFIASNCDTFGLTLSVMLRKCQGSLDSTRLATLSYFSL